MAKPGVFDGFYLIFGFLALNDHGWWRWDALPRGRVIGNRGQQGDWLDRVNPDIGRPQDPDGGRYDPPAPNPPRNPLRVRAGKWEGSGVTDDAHLSPQPPSARFAISGCSLSNKAVEEGELGGDYLVVTCKLAHPASCVTSSHALIDTGATGFVLWVRTSPVVTIFSYPLLTSLGGNPAN